MQTPEHLFLTKKKKRQQHKITNNTHTQPIPAAERGALHTQPRSPRLPQPAPDPSARPKFVPGSCVAPRHASGTGLGVAGEERTPGPTLFWCLGVLAPVPRHQVPEGTTKSTLATAKRGPKGWGPGTAVASQAAPRQEEAAGTKAPLPPESLASLPRTTVRGREAASAEPSQPERGWNYSPGAAGLPKAPDSGMQLLASDSAHRAFGTRGGGPGPWQRQESWFPACQGRLRRRASSGETLPCLSAVLVVYFHLSEPGK